MIVAYAKAKELVMKVHKGIISEGCSLDSEGALGRKPGRSRTIEKNGEIEPIVQNEAGHDGRSSAPGKRFQDYGAVEVNIRPHEMSARAQKGSSPGWPAKAQVRLINLVGIMIWEGIQQEDGHPGIMDIGCDHAH